MARIDATVVSTIDNGVLTIVVQGFDPIRVDPTDYPNELVEYAALHGLKQRYVDAAALGSGSTPDEKHAAIMALVTHHRDTGEWARVAGAGSGAGGDGLLVRAVMEVFGLDRDTARAQVGAMDKKTQAGLRASPELAPVIARLRVAKAPRVTVDTRAAVADAMAALRGMAPAPM